MSLGAKEITDAQWLAMTQFPPASRIVGVVGTVIAVRHTDGTGALVESDGATREVDAQGRDRAAH